jgi:site-specific DNA recombinase
MLTTVFPSPLNQRTNTLRVLLICRVSSPGEGKQDIRSLDDQEALLRRWLKEHIDQPVEVTVIAGTGSGERLDRKETEQAEELVESRQVDLMLAEDLGRIFRRNRALDFCELAEDYDCRVVAINDRVDTSQDGWRLSAGFAAMRHEMYNADTGKRIRRTLRKRFEQGGAVQFVIYGYIKPSGAKLDSELQKDPAAQAVYDEWFSRLEQGATYAEIADRLVALIETSQQRHLDPWVGGWFTSGSSGARFRRMNFTSQEND